MAAELAEAFTWGASARYFLPPLLTGLFGFVGAWYGGRRADVRKWNQEKSATLAAFEAEMGMMLEVIAVRGLRSDIESYAKAYDVGSDQPMPAIKFGDDGLVTWPVYSKLAEKVGLLSSQNAADVTVFYGCIRAIRASLTYWGTGEADNWPVERKANAIKAELVLFDRAVSAATRVRVSTTDKKGSAQ